MDSNKENNETTSTSTVPTAPLEIEKHHQPKVVSTSIKDISNSNHDERDDIDSNLKELMKTDALAGLEFCLAMGITPDLSMYENLSVHQIRQKLSETYETLFAAIEIDSNDQFPRLMETIKILTGRLEELGYPQPSKLSAQITMTRAQIQVAVKEKKFEKCSSFQDKLDELIAHDAWLRNATKDITSALVKQQRLAEALNTAVQNKEWNICTSLKADLEAIDNIISMVKLENCLTEEDIEKQIAQVEADIGKSVKEGNYGACEVLNRKLESLHVARDLARKSNQMDKDVDASFEMVEQDILETRARAAELNSSITTLKTPLGGGNNHEIGANASATLQPPRDATNRLSPSNLRAHNQEFGSAKYANISSRNEYHPQNNDDAQSIVSNFTSVSTYDSNTFVFKITDNDGNTHRFRNVINRLDALVRKCASRIGLAEGSFKLRYKDEEGDMIVLIDDDDVQEAVEATRNRSSDNKFVRLAYTLVGNHDNGKNQGQLQAKENEIVADGAMLQRNAQRQLHLSDSDSDSEENDDFASFPLPGKSNDCIIERIPVVKRVASGKKKKNRILADTVDDNDDGDDANVSSDGMSSEEEESLDDSESDNDSDTSTSSAEEDLEIEEEVQQHVSGEEEEEYEMILKDQSNWINQSTAAISKNISLGMPSLEEPVTIAIASGVAVLGLLLLFSKKH